MIRQIWKVRNTKGDSVNDVPLGEAFKLPSVNTESESAQMSSLATEKASAAQATTQNDESKGGVQDPQEVRPAGTDDKSQTKSGEQAKTKLKALLGKTSKAAALSVCAYDPHSSTLYALVEQTQLDSSATSSDGQAQTDEESKQGTPSTTKALPGILQMPAALAVATAGPVSELTEERKGEPAISQSAEQEPTQAGSQYEFSPLQDLSAAVAVHDPFAHMTMSEETESSNQTTQVGQATCLRFSPTLSSDHVVITDNGLTTYATQQVGNGEMSSNAAIGSIGFSEGVHYWEIICPIFCNSIDFGVTFNPRKMTKNNTITEQFLSTTKRTVGVMLDLTQGQISFWLNSRMLKKNKTKELKKPGLTWYPYIRLQEPNIPAILNPFCRLPMADNLAPKFRRKLPQSLTNHNLSHGRINFLKTKLQNFYLILNLPKKDHEQIMKILKDLDTSEPANELQITLVKMTEESKERAAVLKFAPNLSESASKWVAAASKQDKNVLNGEMIAKMILSEHTTINTTLGYEQTSSDMVKKFMQGHSEQLLKILFNQEDNEYENLLAYMGIQITSEDQPQSQSNESKQSIKPKEKVQQLQSLLQSKKKLVESSQAVSQESGTQSDVYQISFLRNSNKILMTNGSLAKIVSPEQTEKTAQQFSLFSNYPKSQTDTISLAISKSDLEFLLEKLPWNTLNSLITANFLEAAQSSFDSKRIKIEYFTALQGVQVMLKAAIEQYQTNEKTGFIIEIMDINQCKEVPAPQNADEALSFNDANLLVNILLDFEEQLWAMSQGSQVPQSVRDLWQTQVSRTYQAFTRLSSFAQYHDSEDPMTLAELGLMNYEDGHKKIRHFQDYTVPVESIYENQGEESSKNYLQIALQKQYPANYLLKGLKTWNISLSQTINNLPPVMQRDFIPKECYDIKPTCSSIDAVRTLTDSSFVLTGSKSSASINVWTSTLGLNLAGGFNFKQQAYKAALGLKEVDSVYFNSFVRTYDDKGAIIMVSKKSVASVTNKTMAAGIKQQDDPSGSISSIPPAPSAPVATEESLTPQQDNIEDSNADPFAGFALDTLFDESNNVDVIAVDSAESESDCEGEDEMGHFQAAWFKAKEAEETKAAPMKMSSKDLKQEIASKQQIPKKDKYKKVIQPIPKDLTKKRDPADAAKLLDELTLMGFPADKAKKAVESSPAATLNELIDLILKDLAKSPVPIQHMQQPEKKKYSAYSCTVCTFMNEDNPGPVCSVCESEAPAYALVQPTIAKPANTPQTMAAQTSEKPALEKIDEDEELMAVAKAQKAEKEAEEAQEAKHQKMLQDAEDSIIKHYADAQILEYFLATNKQGKSHRPLISGAAMFNNENQTLDLHFVDFKYRKSYMKRVTGDSDSAQFDVALNARQQALECFYPTLIENARFSESEKAMKKEMRTLRATRLGVARLELSQVDSIQQIGDNIEYDQPVYILVLGRATSPEKEPKSIVISIDHEGAIKIVENQNILDDILGLTTDTESLSRVVVDQADKSIDKFARLIVHSTSNNTLNILKMVGEKSTGITTSKEREIALEPEERVVSVSNGLIVVENATSGKTRSLFVHQEQETRLLGNTDANQPSGQATEDAAGASGTEQRVPESEVLKMSIDPEQVTIESLEKYENLMKGKVAKASSNANYQSGSNAKSSSRLFSIHTWRNDTRSHQREVGTFEMKFEKPTSLVSLNVDLTFECSDSRKLLHGLQPEVQNALNTQILPEKSNQESVAEEQTTQIQTGGDAETQEKSKNQTLGIFSVKGFQEDVQRAMQDEGSAGLEYRKEQFMPLIVERNKQASYNSSFIASRMLVDNDKMFASNYPKPHITFAHMDGDQMSVQKVTIRVPQNTKTGVYPLGEGLVFLSDTLQAFEIANIFRNFELPQYTAWKEQRMKDARPLRPFEPVAFFQFDSNQTITFDIDFQRPAKYILIMPTAFRKKPVKLSQNPDFVPMEIQFFGAVGQAQRQNALECVEINDQAQNMLQEIPAEYDCEVRLLGSDETIAAVKNFKIDQLKVMEHSVSPATIQSLPETTSTTLKFEGLSLIRVTDSNLQLRKIAGVSIVLRSNRPAPEKSTWVFSNATIQGQEATVAKGPSAKAGEETSDNLFGNTEVPTSYYRSCLLSPRFFTVINKPITRIAFDSRFDLKLRLRVMVFLKHMIKSDHEFCQLVLRELDLKSFIEANIMGQSNQTIHQASEFLQCFQGERDFAPGLFEILIEQVQSIPDTYLTHSSYDAVIGMLKWALPLDYQRTLDVLTESLFQKVTLEKIQVSQTKELIEFRTRVAPNSIVALKNVYPFDDQQFTSASGQGKKQVQGNKSKEANQKRADLLTHLKLTQHQSLIAGSQTQQLKTTITQTFSVRFFEEVNLQMLKLYFSQTAGLFSLAVHVEDKRDGSLVFHKIYPPHTIAQFSDHAIYNPDDALKDYALTIGNLSHKCKDLSIKLQLSGSATEKAPAPSCLVEFYGKMDEALEESARAKYPQEFKKGSEVTSLGQSVKFYTQRAGGEVSYVPVNNDAPDSGKKESTKPAEAQVILEFGQTIDPVENPVTKQQKMISTATDDVSQSKQSQEKAKLLASLRDWQSQIQECISAGKPGNVTEIELRGLNIIEIQKSLATFDHEASTTPLEPQRYTAYLINHASDLTKLIKYIFLNGKLEQSAIRDSLLKVHRQAIGSEEGDLSEFTLTLFRHYVVNESGHCVEDMISFIKDCILPLLNQQERKKLFKAILSEFLRVPEKQISQKAVIRALSQLNVPSGVLIGYLGEVLGISTGGEANVAQVTENPISILTSIFILNMASINKHEEVPLNAGPQLAGGDDLTFDQLLKIVFRINLWIGSNEQGFFTDAQKVTLLKLAITNLQLITRNASPQSVLEIMSDKLSVQTFLLELICLNDQELMEIYSKLLMPMLQRLEHDLKTAKPGESTLDADLKQIFVQILQKSQEILQYTFECLINSELNQLDADALKIPGVQKMVAMCENDKDRFIKLLDVLDYTYFGNVMSLNKFHELFKLKDDEEDASKVKQDSEKDSKDEKTAESITVVQIDTTEASTAPNKAIKTDNDNGTTPSQDARVPIRMIKSLIKLLGRNCTRSGERSAFEDDDKAADCSPYSVKQLQQLWSITLESLKLKTIEVSELIEAGVLEEMIQAFLQSSEDIKQTTFIQILRISEKIAMKDKSGKSICNLLFMTLKTTDWTTENHNNVTFLVCQGWLDILIHGVFQDLPAGKSIYNEGPYTITCKLDVQDSSELLVQASRFLAQCLNNGNFEGVSGAKQHIVLKLQIAYAMVVILYSSEDVTGSKSLRKVLSECQENVLARQQLEQGMDHLLLWLFLSGRNQEEETYLSNLSNNSLQTSATFVVKQITARIKEILALVGDCVQSSEAIKVSLRSLVQIVKSINKRVLANATDESMGFDSALRLSRRTNSLFTGLLESWLVSDTTINYFCFDLCGFAFLLDTVGSDEPHGKKSTEETKNSAGRVTQKITSAMACSDLDDLLQVSPGSQDLVKSLSTFVKAKQHPDWEVLGVLESLKQRPDGATDLEEAKNEAKDDIASGEEPQFSMPLQELGKNMVLLQTSTKDPVSSYQRIDWTANKRVYKHKVYIKQKAGTQHLEFSMLFKLEFPALIREIQIAFINFWQIENEVFMEPLSVLVTAGMDQKHLNHVCTLEIVKDNAYNSVHATIFGKNMLAFKDEEGNVIQAGPGENIGQQIEQVIRKKLDSLGNFKAQFIEFHMRRNALTCLENSPLASRILKPQSLSINYISVTGYSLKQAKGKYSEIVNKSQKKTAMEMMSLVCQGEFSSALKVIANQRETIDKIKEQFDFLASLATKSSNISIEPIFIKISTYNQEMGDWIIKQLISKEGTPSNASLTGKLIISDSSMISQRLDLLLQSIIGKIQEASTMPRGSASQATYISSFRQFVSIYIRTLRYASSAPKKSESIDLKVSTSTLLNIIALLNNKRDEAQANNSKVLEELEVLLLVPPTPFINSCVDQVDFAINTLLTAGPDDEACDSKHGIACLLACQNHEIAMKIFDTKKEQLDSLVSQLKKQGDVPAPLSPHRMATIAKFWLNASTDNKVSAKLQEEGLPFTLYSFIREENPKEKGRILKDIDEDLLQALIELILKLSAGHAQSEQDLSLAMIEDIQLLAKIRDRQFINKLLLALIENEVTVPVSFSEREIEYTDAAQKEADWHPDFEALSCGGDQREKKEVVDYSKNFLPSSILDADQRSQLLKGYKEILGSQSKALMQKTLTGKWTCIHSTTEKMGPPSQFQAIWSTIANQGPVFMLLSGSNQTHQNIVYGGFCQKQFPPVGEVDNEYGVAKTPGDFLFASIKDKGVGFYDHDGSVMLEVISDYEGGGSISIGQDFFNISYSYDYALVVGVTQGLDPIKVNGIPEINRDLSSILKPQYNFQIERAEIWIADTNSKQGSSVQQNQDLRQKILKTIGMQAFNQKPHPWMMQGSPFNNFRSRPVFMVPSQIKASSLAQIMLNSKVNLSSQHNQKAVEEQTVQEVYNQLSTDQKTGQERNNILDLEFGLDEEALGLEAEEITEPIDTADLLSKIQSQYVQSCGFFEAFQKNGGVKKFIYVALVSLELWSNKKVAESWKQWLKELDCFSEIPQYFQQAIKNKKYKDLLLKILAGQPDQDAKDSALSLKWFVEQKEAVELNYKILADTFKSHDEEVLREQAVSSGLISRIFEKLSVVSGEKPRVFEEEKEEEKKLELDEIELVKNDSSKAAHEGDVAARSKAKRKGVGYSTKLGERFDVGAYLENKKQRCDQIKVLIDIMSGFIDSKTWKAPLEIFEEVMESALLPILESALRNSSFLELSKEADLYHSYLELLRAISKQEKLQPALIKIDKRYKPVQIDSIYVLLGKLNELGSTFLSLSAFKQQADTKLKEVKNNTSSNQQQQPWSAKAAQYIQIEPLPNFVPLSQVIAKQNPFGELDGALPTIDIDINSIVKQNSKIAKALKENPFSPHQGSNMATNFKPFNLVKPQNLPQASNSSDALKNKSHVDVWKKIFLSNKHNEDEDKNSANKSEPSASMIESVKSALLKASNLKSDNSQQPQLITQADQIPSNFKKIVDDMFQSQDDISKQQKEQIADFCQIKVEDLFSSQVSKQNPTLLDDHALPNSVKAIKKTLSDYDKQEQCLSAEDIGDDGWSDTDSSHQFTQSDQNSDSLVMGKKKIHLKSDSKLVDQQTLKNYAKKALAAKSDASKDSKILNKHSKNSSTKDIQSILSSGYETQEEVTVSEDSLSDAPEDDDKDDGLADQPKEEVKVQPLFAKNYIKALGSYAGVEDQTMLGIDLDTQKIASNWFKDNKSGALKQQNLNMKSKSPYQQNYYNGSSVKKVKKKEPVVGKSLANKQKWGLSSSSSFASSDQSVSLDSQKQKKPHDMEFNDSIELLKQHHTDSVPIMFAGEHENASYQHHLDKSNKASSLSGDSYQSEEDDIITPHSSFDSYYDQEEQKHITMPVNKKDHELDEELAMSSKVAENLAKDVKDTYEFISDMLEDLLATQNDEDLIADALMMPAEQAYKALLEPLRFDYMSMKREGSTTYNHKYKDLVQANQTMPPTKMVRLAQELADLSRAVPCEITNSTFIRVDKDRVDTMKVMICGAEGTPYAHGAFEFDLFCDNNYPNGPPKMNLTTTGNGAIRFNPNLYACGKVCLSLLGTWQGKSTENWDAKISTILQVLMSTQAIIMSEEVYFNEPGFEQEAGTPDGEKRNEGYSNIVRYGNVKYAMLGQLKNPAKGFETVIKRHFYLKKEKVMKTCRRWVERAGTQEANYTHLVNDHNHTIAKDFQKSKTRYKEVLTALVDELEDVLNQLEKPTNYSIAPKEEKKKDKKQKEQAITEGMAQLNDVDMDTDSDEEQKEGDAQSTTMISTTGKQKGIDIDDEAVKDRWSRYIGAMGVEAVAKQAAANIFVSGAGALGIEISKNLVLSGCKSFTLHDTKPVTFRDLSGQFFLNQVVDGKTRAEECMPRLQQLNYYVRCKVAPNLPIPHQVEALEAEPWNFQNLDVIVLTDTDYATAIVVNEYCRSKGKKFILTQLAGVFGRVFNDFGDNFEVLDKNGEDLQDTIIRSITNEEQGIVELLGNMKHKFEDGDEATFAGIEGMKLKEGESHEDKLITSDSLDDTIHKVTVINPYSFKIGDTRKFTPYIAKGIVKQLRMKTVIKFKSFSETAFGSCEQLKMDENLVYADFEKLSNGQLSHIAFEALDKFKQTNEKKTGPRPWNLTDALQFLEIAKPIADRYELSSSEWKADGYEKKFLLLFAFQAEGTFNPLAAFFGGYVAQETVKAITGKFSPANQFFYYDAMEVLPEFDATKHIETEENKNYFDEVYVPTVVKTKEVGHRSDGLRICLGDEMIDRLAYTNLFMVGAGAIGCELLKNYAMLGVGTGKAVIDQANVQNNRKPGSIVLTDPDIIEMSNLNRQFLFREKHLRKPKSQTAAAAAIYMNKELKGNIIARLDKVCEATSFIFTDSFFEATSVVTNALDNVEARKYIDARCVTAKTPLLESGTLGPKGHVQVILPYKTESYGSMNDPDDNNEIPHCTLKMFPEETLHCIEWARDKFGRLYTQIPTSAIKILEQGNSINPANTQDIISLKEGLKLLRKRPKNFMDCVEYARMRFEKLFNHDILQLMHVYPLDAVTKDGSPFWTLPKKPPTPIEFSQTNDLHCTFINSMACLRAKMFFVELPSEQPRSDQFRRVCGEIASQFTPAAFIPNEDKAKAIQQSVNKEEIKKDAAQEQEEEKKGEDEEEKKEDLDEIEQLKQEFLGIYAKLNSDPQKPIGNQDWIEKNLVKSDEFEKDNDANFHIDFMYSMGNCRASCYKLEPMDWITVKLKAGRIVPALATTTASISGLQTLELVKILKGCKMEDHRNIFLNLAVPMMQASEPGAVMKEKLLEGLEVSLWDRWQVTNAAQMTLSGFIAHLETTYVGLAIRDVLKGGQAIYFYSIMNIPEKAKEKKKVMSTLLSKLSEIEAEETYVDLTITCVRKDDQKGDAADILAGVPPVRVFFK